MTTDQDIEAFLSHYGVKGMKWGRRKDRKASGSTKRKTTGLERVGWIGGGYVVGGVLGNKVAAQIMSRSGSLPVAATASLAITGASMYAIRKMMVSRGDTKVSSLKPAAAKAQEDATAKEVEEFIKKAGSR